ncbi:rod shape-determining protein RodA [Anaerobacillus arseniciselenatis]|uniref:Rod shape-determining protein RodA n=1 Tax=Anaerobacillus arseniciselenatis TaxID=85682 RepID=A0A1S2LA84_9BACI|nr:rod shape-determining protein RodA [Anaerobacillus arseniciselenatis]OIJ09256.1 rod shape-determining protein RodA [Anaerobacillus arseniciselenatis]
MHERKTYFQQLDYTLLFLLFLLMCISLLSIYSAAMAGQYNIDPSFFVKRQVIWFLIGTFLMVAAMLLDYDLFKNFTIPLYVVGLLLLIGVHFFGVERNGSQRWLGIGNNLFQPSEFVKIFLVLALAHLLFLITKDHRDRTLKEDLVVVAKVLAVGLPPFALILVQPDLGTALVIASIMGTMLLMAGVSWKIFAALGTGITFFLGTLVWLHNNYYEFFTNNIIRPHQLSRIYGWIDPESDPGGMGYQLLNAMQGIGSGQLYGKGFADGVLSKSGAVPEIHTDFIFTVIGEEFGFLGATILIVIYFLLFYRMIIIAFSCNNIYGSYLVAGVIGLLVFQIFQNIGMTIGLMPITGLALPFISYGGSALLTNMIAIGLVLNVNIRTRHYMFSSDETA